MLKVHFFSIKCKKNIKMFSLRIYDKLILSNNNIISIIIDYNESRKN